MTADRITASNPEDRLAAVLVAYLEAIDNGQPVDRQELLARHPELASELTRFLDDQGQVDGFAAPLRAVANGAASPPVGSDPFSQPASCPVQLGDFRILGELGRGGMGVVYHAEQISLRRPVALKVLPIAATLDPRQRQRFHNEAQAAASLQHGHIVPVYAVGCARGIHYYAMQLIHGLPLTTLIQQQTGQQSGATLASAADGSNSDPNGTSPPPSAPASPPALEGSSAEAVSSVVPRGGERDYFRWVAQLGVQAAEALDHAHQMGVVHRDVKPANLLVDHKGQVWITDFGLAMMRQHEGSLTQSGDLVGTLRYMSPEQAQAQRAVLDHRTDVYSLGATLYELLVLQPAFVSTDRQELLRQVVNDEPVRPRAVRRSIPVDLETVVLKAMEKSPAERYATAQEMADDLRRWLEDRPIQARRPSLVQRLRKWGRRHRALVASLFFSVAVVLVMSTVAAGIYAVQQRRLAEEEERGRQQALESAEQMRVLAKAERQAREVAEKRFLQIARNKDLLSRIFKDLDPSAETKWGPSLREQLRERMARNARQLDEEAVGDSLMVADLQNTLGETLEELGEPDQAASLLSRAVATRTAILGPDDPDTLESLNILARAYQSAGQLGKALVLFQQTVAKRQEKLGPDHPDTLNSMNNLALAYLDAGRRDKAVPLLEQTLAKRQNTLGRNHRHTLKSMNNLAAAYQAAGRLDKALPLLEQVLAKSKEKLGPDHPDTLNTMSNLAAAYQDAGRRDKALPLLEHTLAKSKEKLGPDHSHTLTLMNNLAKSYQDGGEPGKALKLYEQTLAKLEEKYGPDHPDTLGTLNNLATAYWASGQPFKALPLFEQALVRIEKKRGPEHPHTLGSMNNLAAAYWTCGQLEKALPLFEQVLAKQTKKQGRKHPHTLTAMNNLAGAYRAAGQLGKAMQLLEETLAKRKESLGADHPETLATLNDLALVYQGAGRLGQALPLLEQTLVKRRNKLGPDHPDTLNSMNNLADACRAAGQLDRALPLFEETLAKRKEKLGPDHPDTLTTMNSLGTAYWANRQLDRSVRLFEELLPRRRQQLGADHLDTLAAQANLAVNLRDSGRLDRAASLFEDALQRAHHRFHSIPPYLTWIRPALVETYERAGQHSKAESLLRQILQQAPQQEKESLQTVAMRTMLGFNLLQQKKYADAEPILRECLSFREKKQPGTWTTFNTQSLLGGTLLGLKKYTEAEPLLAKGYQGMKDQEKKIPPQGKVRLVEAAERLMQLHETTGHKEEAARWHKVLQQEQTALRAAQAKDSKQNNPRR